MRKYAWYLAVWLLAVGGTAFATENKFVSMDPSTCKPVKQGDGSDKTDLGRMIPGATFPQFLMKDPTCKKKAGDEAITYCVQLAKCLGTFDVMDDTGNKVSTMSAHFGMFLTCEAQKSATGDYECGSAPDCAKSKVELSLWEEIRPLLPAGDASEDAGAKAN
jgi:hypothetical protein